MRQIACFPKALGSTGSVLRFEGDGQGEGQGEGGGEGEGERRGEGKGEGGGHGEGGETRALTVSPQYASESAVSDRQLYEAPTRLSMKVGPTAAASAAAAPAAPGPPAAAAEAIDLMTSGLIPESGVSFPDDVSPFACPVPTPPAPVTPPEAAEPAAATAARAADSPSPWILVGYTGGTPPGPGALELSGVESALPRVAVEEDRERLGEEAEEGSVAVEVEGVGVGEGWVVEEEGRGGQLRSSMRTRSLRPQSAEEEEEEEEAEAPVEGLLTVKARKGSLRFTTFSPTPTDASGGRPRPPSPGVEEEEVEGAKGRVVSHPRRNSKLGSLLPPLLLRVLGFELPSFVSFPFGWSWTSTQSWGMGRVWRSSDWRRSRTCSSSSDMPHSMRTCTATRSQTREHEVANPRTLAAPLDEAMHCFVWLPH